MNTLARIQEDAEAYALPRSRAGLVRYLARLCHEAGADRYMLVKPVACSEDEIRIVASNWIYDTIEAVGMPALAAIVHSDLTTFIGTTPRIWRARGRQEIDGIPPACIEILEASGHVELAALRLRSAGTGYCLILSSSEAGAMAPTRLPGTLVALSYALVALDRDESGGPCAVTDRERECLRWVAEGKTTDETAQIVGVSGNTVNSYLSTAIQKLSARNRAMAIAIAIRQGLI